MKQNDEAICISRDDDNGMSMGNIYPREKVKNNEKREV